MASSPLSINSYSKSASELYHKVLSVLIDRRDEIKFTDFGENTNVLYSLSNFRTADWIRKGEDYMTNYLKGRYGALKFNDFTDIMKTLFKQDNS